MIRTLRLKFICVTMAIVAVSMLVIFCLVIHSTGEALESESIAMLREAADEPPMTPGRPGQIQRACFVIRVTSRGYSIQTDGGFDLSDETMVADIVARAASSSAETGEIPEYSLRFLRQQRRGELTLAFSDISGEESTLRNLKLTCLVVGILALLAFWAVSVLLAKWAVRPVERAWAEQRQFIADASHELKTPLTVILTNAELLQSGDGGGQYAHSILTMSHQMRLLVEGLLELARVDNGAARASFEDVDLSQLVDDELLPFEPLYFERGLTLDSAIDPGLHISGSPRHLRQVLAIILDNAMKYAPAGSTVSLRLTRQGNHALLTASNQGSPLSREECRNIFRRFYRTDPARSSAGYGLGLPIAQGIVADHGGKIWAESRDDQILFSIQLPIQ